MGSYKISKKPRQQSVKPGLDKRVISYKNIGAAQGSAAAMPQTKGRRLKNFVRHLPFWLASLAIVMCFGYVLTLNSNINLMNLNTPDNPLLREEQVYEQAAKDMLAGSITAKTKISFNKDNFIKAMRIKFPELSKVDVTLPLMGHRPIVKIGSNRPIVALENDQAQLFVLDRQGRALMRLDNPQQPAQMGLLVLKDQSTTPVKLGQAVITEQDAGFIAELLSQLAEKNIKITELTLPAIANELQIKVEGKPYIVKFNTTTDARQSTGALIAIKEKLEKENKTPAEYIDLRVEEKAYYK
jgi:hypothetical protein